MPLKTESIEEAGINLTPMIDVVLLLMIFFMVGTQFIRQESQYEIELPRVAEAQPLSALPDELVISITQDGAIYLGGEARTPAELEADLRAARERYADQIVVIRGDGNGRYQEVMTVLSLCKRARINNIQLANRIEDESGT